VIFLRKPFYHHHHHQVIAQWVHKRDRDTKIAFDVVQRRGIESNAAVGEEEDLDFKRLMAVTNFEEDSGDKNLQMMVSSASKPW
jgi:hypothetical protein